MSFHKVQKKVISVTATTDAEQISQNKVVAQSIEIPKAVKENGGSATIKSLSLIDETNSTLECDIIFTGVSTAISDDEGKAVGEDVGDLDGTISVMLGHVSIASGDYTDLIDARLGTKTAIDMVVSASTGSRSIYMHIINRGSAVTFGETNDVKVNIGIEY